MEGVLQNNAVDFTIVREGDGCVGVLLLEVADKVGYGDHGQFSGLEVEGQ